MKICIFGKSARHEHKIDFWVVWWNSWMQTCSMSMIMTMADKEVSLRILGARRLSKKLVEDVFAANLLRFVTLDD